MSTVRKTITLTEQQDNWVKAQINAGHYTNESECICDLIRREQERSAEIEAVRSALICRRRGQWRTARLRRCRLQTKDAGLAWLNIA